MILVYACHYMPYTWSVEHGCICVDCDLVCPVLCRNSHSHQPTSVRPPKTRRTHGDRSSHRAMSTRPTGRRWAFEVVAEIPASGFIFKDTLNVIAFEDLKRLSQEVR